jgi:thioredoxin 1
MLQANTQIKTMKKEITQITFLELGAETCIPCKMMKPVMKDIDTTYNGKVQVIFHDVTKNRDIAKKYNIRVMPTQIFLDKDGKEFHRHEGFYPKEEIMKILDPKLGIKRK